MEEPDPLSELGPEVTRPKTLNQLATQVERKLLEHCIRILDEEDADIDAIKQATNTLKYVRTKLPRDSEEDLGGDEGGEVEQEMPFG